MGLKTIEVYQEPTKSSSSFAASEKSIDVIKEKEFDILLQFNKKIIEGELLTIANFGILSIDFGSDFEFKGVPTGFLGGL